MVQTTRLSTRVTVRLMRDSLLLPVRVWILHIRGRPSDLAEPLCGHSATNRAHYCQWPAGNSVQPACSLAGSARPGLRVGGPGPGHWHWHRAAVPPRSPGPATMAADGAASESGHWQSAESQSAEHGTAPVAPAETANEDERAICHGGPPGPGPTATEPLQTCSDVPGFCAVRCKLTLPRRMRK